MARRAIAALTIVLLLLVQAYGGAAAAAQARADLKVEIVVPAMQRVDRISEVSQVDYTGKAMMVRSAVRLGVFSNVPWQAVVDVEPMAPGVVPVVSSVTVTTMGVGRGSTIQQHAVVTGSAVGAGAGAYEVTFDLSIPASSADSGTYPLQYSVGLWSVQ
ncbi:MAG: hypothetical protein VB144_09595 [Clostridia bacterium]|nr:hypothetical protein [Clostridia bacterium]